MKDNVLLGMGKDLVSIPANRLNYHGFITGSTGTGKTVTMKVFVEELSRLGVNSFVVDVKGDFSGIAVPNEKEEDMKKMALEKGAPSYEGTGFPTEFWDIYRQRGIPLRFSVSDLGPLFISELLELNDAQSNHLHTVFDLADEEGLLLMDFKDLTALMDYVSQNYKNLPKTRSLSPQSLAAIRRKLNRLSYEEVPLLFGEPSLEVRDLMDRRGTVHVLDGKRFAGSPTLYSIFLTKFISDLYETLDEVGNQDLPELVLFFDEAHLLFAKASSMLLEKMSQAVRLIRSKGVGIYFVTQSPSDIPDEILNQCGHRILHQQRAFSPKEIKNVNAVAQILPQNSSFDTAEALMTLPIATALISVLKEDGTPTPVERTMIFPPRSSFSPIPDEKRKEIVGKSRLFRLYEEDMDPESAYEILGKKMAFPEEEKEKKESSKKKKPGKKSVTDSFVEKTMDSFVRNMANQVGRSLARNLFGNLKKR